MVTCQQPKKLDVKQILKGWCYAILLSGANMIKIGQSHIILFTSQSNSLNLVYKVTGGHVTYIVFYLIMQDSN